LLCRISDASWSASITRGKVSPGNKVQIFTSREQKLGAEAIVAVHTAKRWNHSTVEKIYYRLVYKETSATERLAWRRLSQKSVR